MWFIIYVGKWILWIDMGIDTDPGKSFGKEFNSNASEPFWNIPKNFFVGNWLKTNRTHSSSIRANHSLSESFRNNPKSVLNPVRCKSVKNQSNLYWFNPIIRINFLIRENQNSSDPFHNLFPNHSETIRKTY